MQVEKIILNEQRDVTLTAYLQDVGGEFQYVMKRPAILVMPGGAYRFCSDREADPVALAYLKAGYQAFILRYSVEENAVWPNPLDDYEHAMELIRSKADEWNLYADKVAVIGFSAGGHLAAAAATMSKNRPNAAILGYAVAGKDVKGCNKSAPDTVEYVDKNTCPCFLFATRTDNVVPIMNSIQFMEALAKNDIAFESHIYAYGPHGFSTCDTSVQSKDTQICERVPNWVADSIGWLRDVMGEFGEGCMTEQVCSSHVTDDYKEYLSVDCTLGCILQQKEAAKLIEDMIRQAEDKTGVDVHGEMDGFVHKMKLRDVLAYGGASSEDVDKINLALNKMKNILE